MLSISLMTDGYDIRGEFFVFVGITEEVIAYYKMNIIVIEDFRNFSMVILQIQAGVSTIIVALIALISGMINEEVDTGSTTLFQRLFRICIMIFVQLFCI